ncbi:oligoendopeptidase F [bacterium]
MLFFKSSKIEERNKNRNSILVEETWNLFDLYASDAEWEEAKKVLSGKMDDVLGYKGRLSESSAVLLSCLEFNSSISKEFHRLYAYASMKSDGDTRNAKHMGMRQAMSQLGTEYSSKSSFIEPELLSQKKILIDKFIAEEPKLNPYRVYLNDLLRRKKHTLSENEEQILAEAGLLADGPHSIYTIFSNAELPYPEIQLSDGQSVRLDPSGYSKNRALRNRKDREKVFQSFWNTMRNFEGTFGAQLYAHVKKDIFYARARKYNSSLESALDSDKIPIEVYKTLIQNVHDHMDTFHRYLNLRRQLLNVDILKYSDIYAPTVKGVDLNYTFSEAKDIILEAMGSMGSHYISILNDAFTHRWIDVYPSTGKRSGAYSSGDVYDVHPYILMNYNEKYTDVSTLAHELGHTVHSYLSNKTQPYPMARYSIFVAEVASTFNEALLHYAMMNKIHDSDSRLSLLMEYLDSIKGTIFRQTQFAEFELKIHELAEMGEPLTGQVLTQIYGEIIKEYYGHDKGLCEIDDLYRIEWTYIPHFYYNFYVYQYATSFTASTALAERVINQEKGAVDNMIAFLSSGSSDYPVDLLIKSGVDMLQPGPFNKTMGVMNRTMDEIEALLKEKGKKDIK